MAKFVYSMQNILNIKYKLEDQAKAEFSMANIRLKESEEQLNQLIERRWNYEEELRKCMDRRLDLFKIRELQNAVEQLKRMIKEQKQVVQNRRTETEEARNKLNAVMQERKTHEKLKENAWEAFLQELNEEEKKEIDELVSYTYHDRIVDEED